MFSSQQTYDTFIQISKALNKTVSLQHSATTNISKLLELIRKNAVDNASSTALKQLWTKFNRGKENENLGLKNRKFLSHKLEELLRSLKK